MEVGLHVIDKEENQTYDETMYGWLVRGKVGSLRFKASAFDEMWPLAVGNQFKTQYNIATYSVALRGEVTRTEFIRVPAGEFLTYVIEGRERLMGYPAKAKVTMWYAPKL